MTDNLVFSFDDMPNEYREQIESRDVVLYALVASELVRIGRVEDMNGGAGDGRIEFMVGNVSVPVGIEHWRCVVPVLNEIVEWRIESVSYRCDFGLLFMQVARMPKMKRYTNYGEVAQ